MDSYKAEKIARLVKEKEDMQNLISWHEDKCFIFADIKIEATHPIHSRLVAVFQEQLKYVESELEGME